MIQRAQEDARQTKLIHEAREEWQGVRQPHLHDVLLDQGEQSCPNRVARLAWQAGIKAQVGYKRRPDSYCGTPSVVIDNTLDRQFAVSASDAAWVTDTTFIRTHEGFAYTPEQIIGMLREAEVRLSQGEKVGAISRSLGISEQSYYRWRREYGGLKVSQARRLKDLEKENQRLRKAVSDLTLDALILKEVVEGKY